MNLEVSFEFDTPKKKEIQQHTDTLWFWLSFVASLREHSNGILKDKLLPDYINIDSSARNIIQDAVEDYVYTQEEAEKYKIKGVAIPSFDGKVNQQYIEVPDELSVVDFVRGREYLTDLLLNFEIVSFVSPITILIDFEEQIEYPLIYEIK